MKDITRSEDIRTIVITGAAGFIGFHVSNELLNQGYEIYGIDSINDYYDTGLKNARLKILESENFKFLKEDISSNKISKILSDINPDIIINLAAQAGVRHSLKNPHDYIKNNITGFLNILEYGKNADKLKKIIYASTSSVYGGNEIMPFTEIQPVDKPLQFYAVSKRANELMAEAYANLYQVKTIGLRFFTVYGPWGRPDMALFKFTRNILLDQCIDIYNNGDHIRDFTYVSDIADGVIKVATMKSKTKESLSEIYNIGGSNPVPLMDFVKAIEQSLNKTAIKNFLPMQPGDVHETRSSVDKISKAYGYVPRVNYKIGIKNFVEWYRVYYNV